MKTKKRINAATLLAAASLAISPSAWALGLGDITVESFLNQPLQLKIDLVTRETDDLTAVTAKLASAEDYELIGASLESVSVPIRFSIEDIDGDAYIVASSSLPVGSPVLRLIVEVNWSSGRLLREYTIFLDPPAFNQQAPIPRVDQYSNIAPVPAAQEPEPVAQPPAVTAPASEPSPPNRPTRNAAPVDVPADGEYGPVGTGETLWGIASNWSRGTGLDMNRVMIAIQRENPGAFMNDNINLLKRGAILRLPSVEDVQAISTAQANSEVFSQSEEFQTGASGVPMASPSTPLLSEEAALSTAQESDVGSEDSALEQDATLAESEAEQLLSAELADEELELSPTLELVPPSDESDLDSAYGFEESDVPGVDATVAVSALREDLARTEEDLVTQQQQNEYLEERIQELESQLASAEEDRVNDPALANMEERLRQERLAAEAAEKPASKPWYSGITGWLIGLLVLGAGFGAWLLYRRRIEDEFYEAQDTEQIREIKDEAEEVLRVLKGEETVDTSSEDTGKEKEPESMPDEPQKKERSTRAFGASEGDAEVLDEESSDPEIQLDLARAYISMGDKEAARVILEEVGSHGSEEQQAEASKMLNALSP